MIKLKDCECTNCDTVNVVDPSKSQFECGMCSYENEIDKLLDLAIEQDELTE